MKNGGKFPPFCIGFMKLVNNESPLLDERLSLVASFVREGAVLADVGTDHAYLPIFLILNGISERAVASDIHEAPLERAKEHAEKYGVANRISFYLADGVSKIDLQAEGVTDIAICGMGGEMIADILAAAPYTRLPGVRCILQPMSSIEDLRRYLAAAGYRIEDERLASAGGKIYTCLSVLYDDVVRECAPIAYLLGEAHIRRGALAGDAYAEYLRREYESALKKYRGRRLGNLSVEAEESLLCEMEKLADEAFVHLDKTERKGDRS